MNSKGHVDRDKLGTKPPDNRNSKNKQSKLVPKSPTTPTVLWLSTL